MNRVERLEHDVRSLTAEERAAFRDWFAEFDWNSWDGQLGTDIEDGVLDSLAEAALKEHREGLTRPL